MRIDGLLVAALVIGCSNDFDALEVGAGAAASSTSSAAGAASSAGGEASSSSGGAASASSTGTGGSMAGSGGASGGRGGQGGLGGAGGAVIVPAEACPGVVVVVGATPITTGGDTSLMADDSSGGICAETPSGGDAVYALMPLSTGELSVVYHGDFKKLLYRSGGTCARDENEQCDLAPANTDATLSFPVEAGTTEYLFVDGYDGGEGPYTLTLVVR